MKRDSRVVQFALFLLVLYSLLMLALYFFDHGAPLKYFP